ncbi:MAG: hypothetical protein WA419_02090 [Silvibacterium sp.]
MFAHRVRRDRGGVPESALGRFARQAATVPRLYASRAQCEGQVEAVPASSGNWNFGNILVFSASAQPQHDSKSEDREDKSEGQTRTASVTHSEHLSAKVPMQGGNGAGEEKAVHFPEPLGAAAQHQADGVTAALGYQNSITQADPKPDPKEFGTTRPYFTIDNKRANLDKGIYTVNADVNAKITFQVDGGTRKNVGSADDAAITQTNYPTVVSDLTPSATAHEPDMYKNQPPRTQFWAEDLTITHERFHANEDVAFGREGTTAAQNWLNQQTARSYDDIGRMFAPAIQKVAGYVDTKMAAPGRERRAYDNGAADYKARADAIKTKGDAKGYVPRPATPPAPTAAPPAPKGETHKQP